MLTPMLEERGRLTILEFAGVATDVGVATKIKLASGTRGGGSLKPLSTPHTRRWVTSAPPTCRSEYLGYSTTVKYQGHFRPIDTPMNK